MTHRSYIHLAAVIVFIATILLSSYGYCQGITDDIEISAETIEYLSKENKYRAMGSVEITSGNTLLKADRIDLDKITGDSQALGNVYYEDSDTIIQAKKADINLKTKKGTIYDAHITYKGLGKVVNYYATSHKIERQDEDVFYLEDATLTTCEACPPDWKISGKKVTIRLGRNITARDVKFAVKDLTVLYSPYVWLPYHKERESGILFPEFGGGEKRGFTYRQGVYWAIDDYKDMTFYSDVFAKKGWGKAVDARYNFSEDTRGEFWVYHIKDTDVQSEDRDYDTPNHKDFVEVKAYHNQTLPFDIEAYYKIHTVSHDDYYEELDSTSEDRFGVKDPYFSLTPFYQEERLQKYLETNVQLMKMYPGARTYLLGQYRRNLEGSSDVLSHPAPEFGQIFYTRSLSPESPVSYNFETIVDNFWSDENKKGQRYDLHPSVYLNLGREIAFSQEVGFRETYYSLSNPDNSLNREKIELTSNLSTKFIRKYSSFSHLIEPFVQFYYESILSNEDEFPDFDSVPDSDEAVDLSQVPDFDLIDLAPEDLIPLNKAFTYSLRNTFKGKFGNAWLRIAHGYTLIDNVKSRSLPIVGETTLNSGPVYLDFHTRYDTHERSIFEMQSRATYRWDSHYLSVGRIYRRSTDLDQYQVGLGAQGLYLDLPVDLLGLMWFDANGNGVQKAEFKATYNSQCWASTFTYRYREDELRFLFGVELKGIGSLGMD
jgi:LPS-assembly protein